MKLMLLFNILFPIMYMSSQHPVMYMLVILTQTIFLCILANLMIKFSWFSYILFLIFLGGLMVLFIYITSLASNEKFTYSLHQKYMFLMGAYLVSMIMIFNSLSQLKMPLNPKMVDLFKEMYHTNSMMLTALAMTYLLLTLIVVIKVTSKYKGPLRSVIS